MWTIVLSHRGCDVEPVLCFIMRPDTAGMCAQHLSNADDNGRSFFLQPCLHEEQLLFYYKAKLERAGTVCNESLLISALQVCVYNLYWMFQNKLQIFSYLTVHLGLQG